MSRKPKYTIEWRRLANPSLWTRACARVRHLVLGRTPYLRPPCWSNEHSPQTLRKIYEYENQIWEQIKGDRALVRLFFCGMVIGAALVGVWAWLSWLWQSLR